MKEVIYEVLNDMASELNVSQLKKLQEVLVKRFDEKEKRVEPATNNEYLSMFLNAKKIEGCSDRTIIYYQVTIEHLLKNIIIHPYKKSPKADGETSDVIQDINTFLGCTKYESNFPLVIVSDK